MRFIYRGFMIGIGIAVAHAVFAAVLLACFWSAIEPVLSAMGLQL